MSWYTFRQGDPAELHGLQAPEQIRRAPTEHAPVEQHGVGHRVPVRESAPLLGKAASSERCFSLWICGKVATVSTASLRAQGTGGKPLTCEGVGPDAGHQEGHDADRDQAYKHCRLPLWQQPVYNRRLNFLRWHRRPPAETDCKLKLGRQVAEEADVFSQIILLPQRQALAHPSITGRQAEAGGSGRTILRRARFV